MSPPADSDTNSYSVDLKVLQYEKFIDEVLKKDLQRVMEQRDAVYEQISHYLQLKNTLQALQGTDSQCLKADVDLGCNFYAQAQVEDSSKIYVLVGFGFFVEMEHDEALRFIDKKTSQLTAFTDQLTNNCATIKANIRLVLEGLRELQGLVDLPERSRREVF
ncbi:protein UXT [Corythoichthys intestinalis]|uniref:protein UXT n=1 Tax=Corythoichthys intestinalis TaxID=161448 RepID=UPI0025A6770A|nr:protein UXT [Corythoichthys intestinalis]XP_061803565.1 protein UXT-like [Nerophis lumbriciformis]